MTTCLDENHWNIFDRNCSKCQSEIEESKLLDEYEFAHWKAGKFTLGFKIIVEGVQINSKSAQVEDNKRSRVVVSEIL